ncbi:MAG: tetratricopeptide repeat protein, partial [Candidatus Binatia bacterium]
EFPSVVEAMAFAVEVQLAMRERCHGVPEDRQILYRVGINIGDIIVEGDDIYGDGVNVAARLEGLAEPGGICVRRNVRNQVRDKLDLDFEDLGEIEVKNIVRSVRVFRVVLDDKAAALVTPIVVPHLGAARPSRWRIATAVAVCLVVIGGLAWWQVWWPFGEGAGIEKAGISRSQDDSIAVLAFKNLSGDPEQDYFSDAIAEDITTELSRFSELFVISRESAFSYKHQSKTAREIGRELGVRYLLEGSVQRSGDRLRVTVQLIDSSTGKHLWADRYDRKLDNFFDLQDEITLKVVLEVLKGMEVKLSQQDIANIKYSATENVEAWSYYAKGLDNYRRTNAFNNAQARKYFNQALKLDPMFEAAMLGVAWTYYAQARWHWATGKYPYDRRDEFLAKAAQTAQLVMTRNDALAEPAALLGQVYVGRGNFDKAISFAKRAVAHNPNNADFHLILADILSFAGKPREALPQWEIATHLNPFPSDDFRFVHGRILYQLKRFEEAIPIFEGIVERNPDVFGGRERLRAISLTLLIASYSAAGNPKAKDLALKYPHSYGTILEKFFLFKEADDSQRVLDDLAKAGLKY